MAEGQDGGWIAKLTADDVDGAWDLFVEQYRRLIFATIRHFTSEHDEVMDLFAHVCQALREDRMARVRSFLAQATHRARFTTWLVVVIRHQVIDWYRRRDGRPHLSRAVAALPPLQQRIFEYVFLDGCFSFENPNATGGCGCGTSFSV